MSGEPSAPSRPRASGRYCSSRPRCRARSSAPSRPGRSSVPPGRAPLHALPQRGEQREDPVGVVVVAALGAVGEPAALAHEGLVQGEVVREVGQDRIGPVAAHEPLVDRAQEGEHDDPEPHPVVVRIRGADDLGEPVDQALADLRVQVVPDLRAGGVEGERERARLDLRLPAVRGARPGVLRSGVDARREPGGVPVRMPVGVHVAAGADQSRRQQE